MRALSYFTKVDGLATFGEEEESVETLEEHSGWLMDLGILARFI